MCIRDSINAEYGTIFQPSRRRQQVQRRMLHKEASAAAPAVQILGFTVSAPPLVQLSVCTAGVFLFYMAHDLCQEAAFRVPGFSFGWFMTLFEITVFSVAAFFELRSQSDPVAIPPSLLLQLLGLSAVLMGSQGFGNASLSLITFPLKVVFKSCKLVPAMGLGLLVLGKSYSTAEYGAALLLSVGLGMFTIGNAGGSAAPLEGSAKGLLFISLAVLFDALQPNLQEKLLQSCAKAQMIFYSNAGCGVMLTLFSACTGELQSALRFMFTDSNGLQVLLILTAQACSGYAGLQFYLAIVKRFGGVNAVIVTSLRKVATIVLSFTIFPKPVAMLQLLGGACVCVGVAVSVHLKRAKEASRA
eukprot:TRINITY_DN10388_c0_g1_i1.p1 TRINITY_DN10388_c0_g1~~TRINITY_DN10388_c0_g1_i1.p1  ORF type:complete len:358 (-),score=98.62 TRINITY_DN10388_c0_g1_i1:203-1276(-)